MALVLLVFFLSVSIADGLRLMTTLTPPTSSRRSILSIGLRTIPLPFLPLLPSNSACLPGDTDTSCIGNYVIPLDDEIKDFLSTPESVRKYAPDLRWVEPVELPPTSKAATQVFKEATTTISSLRDFALSGDFTTAGKEVLSVSPRIEMARRRLSETMPEGFDEASTDLVVHLNQLNILLGQAIRGELGRLIVAQIIIIKEVDALENLHSSCLKFVK